MISLSCAIDIAHMWACYFTEVEVGALCATKFLEGTG